MRRRTVPSRGPTPSTWRPRSARRTASSPRAARDSRRAPAPRSGRPRPGRGSRDRARPRRGRGPRGAARGRGGAGPCRTAGGGTRPSPPRRAPGRGRGRAGGSAAARGEAAPRPRPAWRRRAQCPGRRPRRRSRPGSSPSGLGRAPRGGARGSPRGAPPREGGPGSGGTRPPRRGSRRRSRGVPGPPAPRTGRGPRAPTRRGKAAPPRTSSRGSPHPPDQARAQHLERPVAAVGEGDSRDAEIAGEGRELLASHPRALDDRAEVGGECRDFHTDELVDVVDPARFAPPAGGAVGILLRPLAAPEAAFALRLEGWERPESDAARVVDGLRGADRLARRLADRLLRLLEAAEDLPGAPEQRLGLLEE